jgi:hypothetical protein
MALFLSVLFTISFAFWFYKTATRLGANGVQWGIVGAISYQIPAWGWMLVVSKPYISAIQGAANRASTGAGLVGHSWILVGLVCVLLVYKFALLKTNVKN